VNGAPSRAEVPPLVSDQPVRLKELALYLGLNSATISVVLSDRPGRPTPDETPTRIKDAATQLGYQPNLVARYSRSRRMAIIGIIVPALSMDNSLS